MLSRRLQPPRAPATMRPTPRQLLPARRTPRFSPGITTPLSHLQMTRMATRSSSLSRTSHDGRNSIRKREVSRARRCSATSALTTKFAFRYRTEMQAGHCRNSRSQCRRSRLVRCRCHGQRLQRTADGSVLTDLAGYKLYYGKSAGRYNKSIRIDNPTVSSYLIDNLLPDTYYVVATSFNAAGIESAFSNEAVKTVISN